MASVAIVNPTQSIAPDVNIVSPKNNDTPELVNKVPSPLKLMNASKAIIVEGPEGTSMLKCISDNGKAECNCKAGCMKTMNSCKCLE